MIKMIWCEDLAHGLGYNGQLPWSNKEEMLHFRATTINNIIVCGRKTYESFPFRPLKNRTNIVITNNKDYDALGALIYTDVNKMINDYKNNDVYIVGGKKIYELFFPLADELIISTLNKQYKCDTFMKFDLKDFKKTNSIKKEEFIINYYSRVK